MRRMQSPRLKSARHVLGRRDGEALWYSAPGRAEIRAEPLAAPGPGEVRVRALFSAISRGTERLVLAGPRSAERVRAHARPVHGAALSRFR